MNELIQSPQARGELSVAAQAAGAKALIEARFTVALNRPRVPLDARNAILEACRRPAFAAGALYAKPIGNTKIVGLSIRFAETALQAWGNVDISSIIVFEDEFQRQVRISIVDLERNITFGDDVILAKTVERRSIRDGQTVISKRENSTGETVFLVEASEDELATKVAAAKSKAIRNSGLRLIPSDFLEEARAEIEATRRNRKAEDPQAEVKRIVDAFSQFRINPGELVKYLGHGIETVSPSELEDLRNVYQAIKEGETSWSAIIDSQNAGRVDAEQHARKTEVLPLAGGAAKATRKPRQGTAPAPEVQVSNPVPHPAQTAQESQEPARQPEAPSPAAPAQESIFNPLDEPEPEETPADKLRTLAKDAEVTEGEVLAAFQFVKFSVGESLDSTPVKSIELGIKDFKGLVTLIQTKIRKA